LVGLALAAAMAGLVMVGGRLLSDDVARAAGTLIVNSTADGDLTTLNGNSTCDLREAILAANIDTVVGQCDGSGGSDTIVITATGTISLATNLPPITATVTIAGPGSANLTVDGHNDYRQFYISSTIGVEMIGLKLAGGTSQPSDPDGGAIHNRGTLRLKDVTIVSSSAAGYGGAIYAHSGSVTLLEADCQIGAVGAPNMAGFGGGIFNLEGTVVVSGTVSHNVATSDGGGLFNAYGRMVIQGGTVFDNRADDRGGGGFSSIDSSLTVLNATILSNTARVSDGGGLASYSALTVTNSTVMSNSAGDEGGGIYCQGAGTVTGSAILSNTAGRNGGGIGNGFGTLALANSTVSGNRAGDDGGGVYEYGCFKAGTLIAMADGSYERIADIQVGDAVLGFDFGAGKRVVNTVQRVFQLEVDGYLEVNGLQVTESHPFAVGVDEWLRAGQLQVGDWVMGGGPVEIIHAARVHQPATVYNLIVADTYNYYVSDGDDLFLVHNKMGGVGHTAYLDNMTITDNRAGASGGGAYCYGGVLYAKNSIVAGNYAGMSVNDCDEGFGTVTSYGYNLVQNTGTCVFNATHDITGTAPSLGPLRDNGGDTWTHALLPNSPAIDWGSCTDINGDPVTADQRGKPRLGGCDIGAYEYVLDVYLPLVLRSY